MPRPGFVLEVDRSTPPILFWRGEGFSLEKLPADRSRVIYPPEPLAPLDDIDGAIRHALLNPLDQDPLPALLFPGMKLTIAFDDVSLPLPKMRRPDIRQRVIEAVLDLAAEAGVDDVHIIAALGLHRRMTRGRAAPRARRPRLRRVRAARPAVPARRRGLRQPRRTSARPTQGEEVEINKRAAESDLLVYVNINLVAMDGGWKSHGHRPRQLPLPAPPPQPETHGRTAAASWTSTSSELHKSNWRMGKVLRRSRRRRSSRSRRRSTPTRSRRRSTSSPSASGSGRPKDRATYLGTDQVADAHADARWPARSSTRSRRRTR